MIEALVLQAQLALHAGALGDISAQRDPAPVRHRVIMQNVIAAGAKVQGRLEWLAELHHVQAPLPHLIGRGPWEVSALRRMRDDVAHRDADADYVFGEAEHFEEARIEQYDAVFGIDRAQPV